MRWIAPPALRCGSRTCSRCARSAGRRCSATYVGVVDVEGYLHLLSPVNGAYVGRLATDGKPATAQPELLLTGALWQSASGTLYAVSAK